MPYSTKKGFRGTIAKRRYATTRTSRYGDANGGYRRQAMRRMTGPPAALYPRMPTNAMAIKSVDLPDQVIILNGTASPNVLVVPTLGSAFFNRLSNRTRGISLQIRGMVQPGYSNTVAAAATRCRIIIYYDRQSNGANPAISDILLDTRSNASTGTDVKSMINMNNRDRFMILRDRFIICPQIEADGTTGGTVGGIVTDPNNSDGTKGLKYEEFIKLKGLESLYNSTNGGTVGDISAGAFGILAINDDSAGNEAWIFNFTTRFKFLD